MVSVIDLTNTTIGEPTPKAIVAGSGDLDPDGDGLYGDANDDGGFSVGDVLFIQQVTVNPPLVIANPTSSPTAPSVSTTPSSLLWCWLDWPTSWKDIQPVRSSPIRPFPPMWTCRSCWLTEIRIR